MSHLNPINLTHFTMPKSIQIQYLLTYMYFTHLNFENLTIKWKQHISVRSHFHQCLLYKHTRKMWLFSIFVSSIVWSIFLSYALSSKKLHHTKTLETWWIFNSAYFYTKITTLSQSHLLSNKDLRQMRSNTNQRQMWWKFVSVSIENTKREGIGNGELERTQIHNRQEEYVLQANLTIIWGTFSSIRDSV